MLETIITNRRGIEKLGQTPFSNDVAVISITDADLEFSTLKYEPIYWLRLSFDDVDGDVFLDELGLEPTVDEVRAIEKKYRMLTDEQAHQIAGFYKGVLQKGVKILIVQCEHGQSRSAAVVAAVREFEEQNGISVFADDRYYPNKVVFRKVLKFLRKL